MRKGLSYDWEKAKWMYNQSQALHFALMAGSSIPLTWRQPPLELDLGPPVEKAVVAAFGPKESYGFHALEALQCMVERRCGGETGIAALKRAGGVSLKDIMKATDWQAHSVRGFISGTLGKKMALNIESTKGGDGEREYRLAK